MGKASRNKKLKKQTQEKLKKYNNVKLSAAIIDICKPFDYDDLTLDAHERLISIAMVAWNIGRLENEKRIEAMQELLESMADKEQNFISDIEKFMSSPESFESEDLPDSVIELQILCDMIRRKDALYPNDDRIAIDFKIKETAMGRHLSVSMALQLDS